MSKQRVYLLALAVWLLLFVGPLYKAPHFTFRFADDRTKPMPTLPMRIMCASFTVFL